MPTLTAPIQHSTGSPSRSNKARRRNKRHQNWKEVGTLFLFADYMILYIEIPKGSSKKLLILINKFSKVAKYKINIHNQQHFQTLTNFLRNKKIKPIYNSIKAIKYLGINLPKEIKDLYSENYKTLDERN